MGKGSDMPRAASGQSTQLETSDGTIQMRMDALHVEHPRQDGPAEANPQYRSSPHPNLDKG